MHNAQAQGQSAPDTPSARRNRICLSHENGRCLRKTLLRQHHALHVMLWRGFLAAEDLSSLRMWRPKARKDSIFYFLFSAAKVGPSYSLKQPPPQMLQASTARPPPKSRPKALDPPPTTKKDYTAVYSYDVDTKATICAYCPALSRASIDVSMSRQWS